MKFYIGHSLLCNRVIMTAALLTLQHPELYIELLWLSQQLLFRKVRMDRYTHPSTTLSTLQRQILWRRLKTT